MKFNHLILLVFSVVFSSCGQDDRLKTDAELVEKITEVVASGQRTLDLGEIADFNWDSLLILTPYLIPDEVEQQFRINLSRTRHSMIESRDDINQLIFFNKGGPINMVEYPRYRGDFSKNKIKFIRREDAIFDIIVTTQKSSRGDDWIELTKR